MISTTNPATGETLATYPELTEDEIDERLQRAFEQQRDWARTDFAERAALLERVAEKLEQRADELAVLMATEMGKPLAQGRAEAEKCAWACRHYAENAESYLADQPISTERTRSYVHHEPLGVVLAIMPWNFPFWQVFRFVAPALMAGNAAVLKHASGVMGCAAAIDDLLAESGAPQGLFANLVIGQDPVKRVIRDRRVAAVTLTGSTGAGAAVASVAGASLKKSVLELGGSDAYVILEDADLELAASVCASSRMINGGQSCIAAKRFIVVGAVVEEFTERLVANMGEQVMGDPLDEETTLGPMARRDLRDELHQQVEGSQKLGAELVAGGFVPDRPGAFYPPTVLSATTPGMPAFDEETFGPVASVTTATDTEHAIELANTTVFGLGSAVFTRDLSAGEQIAATRLNAGSCFVNALVASDPRLPFGGIKESGYGRELSALGIREFVNAKTVVVD